MSQIGKENPWKVKEAGQAPSFAPSKRDIPKDHNYDPKALKPMAKMLWALGVSQGHALAAYSQFSKLKSSTISPDGMIGGRGYVMGVKDIREKLFAACEALSAISDTIHDEINGPHWKPKLAELTRNEQEDVERFVSEARKSLDDGKEMAEDEMSSMEEENDDDSKSKSKEPEEESESKKPNKSWSPSKWDKAQGEGSKVPQGGDAETLERYPRKDKLASTPNWNVFANSPLPVDTMPGGPRVDSLDRGEQTGPYGSFNEDERPSQEDWNRPPGEEGYIYQTPWDNDLSERNATSGVPDSNTDPTKTDAKDFGIGYGAEGGGLEHEPEHPTGKGVWGPAAELPSDPGGKTREPDGTGTEAIQSHLEGLSAFTASYQRGRISAFLEEAVAALPNDKSDPVARSDYYDGPKGNLVSEKSGLPGTQIPAKLTPSAPHPTSDDSLLASGELPGDGTSAFESEDQNVMNFGEMVEDVTTPYEMWAPNDHNEVIDYSAERPKTGARGIYNG